GGRGKEGGGERRGAGRRGGPPGSATRVPGEQRGRRGEHARRERGWRHGAQVGGQPCSERAQGRLLCAATRTGADMREYGRVRLAEEKRRQDVLAIRHADPMSWPSRSRAA